MEKGDIHISIYVNTYKYKVGDPTVISISFSLLELVQHFFSYSLFV